MKTQTLTKKFQEVVLGVREEVGFTKKHLSTIYDFFKIFGVAGVLIAPIYDLGVTLAIREEGTRRDNLYKIYG